jgi:DNA repair exonuclease SbcCD ATPase subunit
MERERRGGPPKVGGVEVPPPRNYEPRPYPDSALPPVAREDILGWLKAVLEEQREGQRRSDERHREIAAWREQFEERLTKLETAFLKVELADARLENLNAKLDRVLESDRRQNDDILSLKQRQETKAIAESSAATAVQKTESDINRKINWRTFGAAVFATFIAALVDYIKTAASKP